MMTAKHVQSFIGLIILLLSAHQAGAADWMFYGKSNTGNGYYDQGSIKKVRLNIVSVSTKTLYTDVGKLKNYAVLKDKKKAPVNPYVLSHELVQFEIDCHAKIRIASRRICDKRGSIIASEEPLDSAWNRIVPGSNFETLKNAVCRAGSVSGINKK